MTRIGDRVELICGGDQYTNLRPGELGTVVFIDSFDTVHVDWDSGKKLGLIREAGDEWRIVSEETSDGRRT